MKLNLKFFYIFWIVLFLSLSKAYSFDTDCSRFLDDVKKNYEEFNLGDSPTVIQETYGFEIHKKFDDLKDEFTFARDENNHYTIGKILSPTVYNKGLRIGDKILSVNNKDTRDLSEEEISNILLNKTLSKLILEYKNNSGVNKIELEKIELSILRKF